MMTSSVGKTDKKSLTTCSDHHAVLHVKISKFFVVVVVHDFHLLLSNTKHFIIIIIFMVNGVSALRYN